MSEIFMNQAIRNMKPMFAETNNLELIGLISAFFWIIAGLSADPILLLLSMLTTLVIFLYLSVESLLPTSKIYYNIHVASFRRMVAAGLSLWRYTSGQNLGPEFYTFIDIEIPVLLISQISFLAFILIWFGTRYYDQIFDENVSDIQIPFLLLRGLLRGAMITALIYAIFVPDLIPEVMQFPYLFSIYLIEPILYVIYQSSNRTYSTYELTLGNARLPIIALRESLFSNLLILWGTMIFKGVQGEEWQLLRVLHIFALVIVIVQSFNSINEFKKNPLGKDPLGTYMESTPEILQNLNLREQMGHVIPNRTEINLAKSGRVVLEEGSILIPIEEIQGNLNSLILGSTTKIVEIDGERVEERVEGISSALLPATGVQSVLKDIEAMKLGDINFNEYNLPSLDKFEGMIYQLANRLDQWIMGVLDQVTKIDLSNYGVTEQEGYTLVNLPGIMVNETPDMTTVKVANIRVFDAHESSTVRIGNWLNVVDMPSASFVSIPGLTVLDIDDIGSAVSILGFKVSDGIPAETLDKFREFMLEKLDTWEMGLDVYLGRILADKNGTGVFSLSMDGQFLPLLDGSTRTLGDHVGLLKTSDKPHLKYLPANFSDTHRSTKKDMEFIELTGLKDDTGTSGKKFDKIQHQDNSVITENEYNKEQIEQKENDVEQEISKIKKSLQKKTEEDTYKFENIYDVEIVDDEDEP